jgi:uncharacterized spore protein YtfJ
MDPREQLEKEIEKNMSLADRFVTALADRIGASANAKVVFADPVERDGVTVIPVAKARWGFGGGVGRTMKEDGGGGGGGSMVTPIGYICIRDGEATFQRISTLSFPVIVLGGVVGVLILRALLRR